MKTAGIAIDGWKLPVFTRRLNDAGYAFTTHPGLMPHTLLLKVETEFVADLARVVREAQDECRKQ